MRLRMWIEKSITRKLTFALLFTTAVVFLVSVIFIYFNTRALLIKQTESDTLTKATFIAQQVNDYFKEKATIVRQMETNPIIIDFLKTAKNRNEITTNLDYPAISETLNKVQNTDNAISYVWVASEEGNFYIGNGYSISKADYDTKHRPWYAKVMKSRDVSFAEPYFDIETGELTVSIINKLMVGNKVIGFTGIDLHVNSLPIFMSKYKLGRNGYTFLLAEDGTILYHPNKNLVMKSKMQTWAGRMGQIGKMMTQLESGMELVKVNGRMEYIGYSPVSLTDWSVGTAIPEEDALEPLQPFTQTALLFFFIEGIVLVFIVFFLLNYLLRNISLIIIKIQLFANGQAIEPFDFKSPDEIGQIAKAIEQMSNKIVSSMKVIHDYAYYDALTGLLNRRSLVDRLNLSTEGENEAHGKFALFFIDLDNFKLINDTKGHSYGDELLRCVGERLQFQTTDDITVYRFGGDEFIILQNHIQSEQELAEFADKLSELFTVPFAIFDQFIHVNFSAGIAVYPMDGHNAEELLKNSDIAMYRAKELGKNGTHFFNAHMSDSLLHKDKMKKALRKALAYDEFTVEYQVQIDIQDDRIHGFEALIRWDQPELGRIPPNEFIPLAEELGLIIPIGEWIMNEACQICAKLQNDHPVTMSVNVSAVQLRSPNIVETVQRALQLSGIEPCLLVLEITETMLIGSFESSVLILERLRKLGVQIALDDFGTGYSSLSYLKHLPIDILKIDKVFIHDITDDRMEKAMAGSIIHLVHNLGLRVTAEGVESEEQLNYLRKWGCDLVQGYCYSKPIPVDKFDDLWSSLNEKNVSF